METPTISQPVILSAEAVAALPSEPLGTLPGVTHRVLWRAATSMAGVMTIDTGHHLGSHTHRENQHHVWVLEGTARILGSDLGPGSYVHIPSGVEHDIDATSTEGVTVLYLYLP
jgi:quercetin dioxygenase-like cupin family protein